MTPTQAASIAVAVVDDDAIVRAWVRQSLAGSEFFVVGEAESAESALRLLERRRADLILVDLILPDRPGTTLVQSLRRQGTTTPILVITAPPHPGLNELVREVGAQGAVQKQADPAELLKALREVAAGHVVIDYRHPRRPAGQAPLSPRERQVLELVSVGATNTEIAAELDVGLETVKTLLGRSFTKLGVHNRVEAVAAARKLGLLA